MPACIAFYMPG